MPEQQQKFEDMSFDDKRKLIETMSFFPALALIVFIRRNIGFRMLRTNWLLAIAIAILVLVVAYPASAAPFPALVVIFAIVMVGLGIVQRLKRWRELCRGERWHTYSPGVSYLEKVPWPPFLQGHRRVNRFLDPLLCVVIGFIAALLSHMLGVLILVSAICLAIFENALFERILERDLNTLDNSFAAEVQEETVKHFEQPQSGQKRRTMDDTAGIPTGVAPDIEKQVALRKAKRRPPPDNLAPEIGNA